jgi:hypothetical protein
VKLDQTLDHSFALLPMPSFELVGEALLQSVRAGYLKECVTFGSVAGLDGSERRQSR